MGYFKELDSIEKDFHAVTILMLIPDFGKGGAERVFSQLSAELATRHRVIDCVFNRQRDREYDSGNEVVDLNVPAGGNFFLKFYYFFLRVYRLRQIKRKYNIAVCISHLEGADYVNVLSSRTEKVVLCVHGSKKHDKNIRSILGWLRLTILLPVLYRRADDIVAVSQGIRYELESEFGLGGKNIHVINNFFSLEQVARMAKETIPMAYRDLLDKFKVIVSSGRLAPEKNYQLLIDLMPSLLEKDDTLKLMILGAGDMYDALVDRAERTGLRVQRMDQPFHEDNNVFFVGFCKNPFAYMSKSKIFLLPSLWEGFPLVLCEALICGTPAIAYDCPTGPREILAPDMDQKEVLRGVRYTDYGVLIPFLPADDHYVKGAWVTAIVKLLEDDGMRESFSRKGSERMNAFSKEVIMNQWFDLLRLHH